ncbi:MAG: hypothetical protein QM733_19260 [Ilumatobacteraceae bacterium]
MNAITKTMQPSTIAEPRSPCTRHSPGADDGDGQHRAERALRVVHLQLAAGQQVGAEQQDRELEQLRRLERERADGHPGLGAVDLGAEATGERQHHHHHRPEEERGDQAAPEVQWDAHRDPQADRAEHRPHRLLAEHPPRRVALVQLGDRAGRQDHHQAEHHEHGDDHGDQVELDRRRRHRAGLAAVRRVATDRRRALQGLATAVADQRRRAAHH